MIRKGWLAVSCLALLVGPFANAAFEGEVCIIKENKDKTSKIAGAVFVDAQNAFMLCIGSECKDKTKALSIWDQSVKKFHNGSYSLSSESTFHSEYSLNKPNSNEKIFMSGELCSIIDRTAHTSMKAPVTELWSAFVGAVLYIKDKTSSTASK